MNIKNSSGWTPLAEAISYGNRQLIEVILKKLKEQTRKSLSKRKEQLKIALNQLDDFFMELKVGGEKAQKALNKIFLFLF